MSDVEAAVGEVARELAVLRGTSRWLQIPQATGTLLLAHFDGEPARTAEAEARAREEMREACARAGVAAVRHSQQTTDQCRLEVGSAIRATPITATPLADELERSWNEKAALVDEEMIAVRKLLMRFAP